jgi:hypothetical protein
MRKLVGVLATFMAFGAVIRADAAEAFKEGVRIGPAAQSAVGNGVDFDPPCGFMDTLPLTGEPYLNARTNMIFTGGKPGLLDACSGFGVTGFSPPNFLAFNCEAVNRGGTVPKLPLEVTFRVPVSRVTLKVGSRTNAGAQALLTVISADGAVLASRSVVLAMAMRTLAVATGSAVIKKARIAGPCIAVVDDIFAVP